MRGAKFLEAIGIACVMIGLVQGIYGDMWGELYLLIAGVVVFYIGRLIEKRQAPRSDGVASQSAETAGKK